MEELQIKHQEEQKDLLGRISQKKRNTTKRTRKGVNDECERLQRALQDRQQAEMDALAGRLEGHEADPQSIEERLRDKEVVTFQHNGTANGQGVSLDPSHTKFSSTQPPSKKPNRQKARLARRAAEQEAQAAEAAKEAANLPDLRKEEITEMKKHFDRLGFTEISIRPDGHCMYSAVATLLQDIPSNEHKLDAGGLLPYQAVRATTARFISEHPTDFEAFLEEPIAQYTNKIRNTTEWGGQLELQAIARAYGVDINVLQADGRIEKIESGMESEARPIWLTYYRHAFGLGEHYNVLKKGD